MSLLVHKNYCDITFRIFSASNGKNALVLNLTVFGGNSATAQITCIGKTTYGISQMRERERERER